MGPDPELAAELAALSASMRNADGTDRWRLWPGVHNGRLLYAWRLLSSPPAVLRDTTLAGLRARMETFERVLARTHQLGKALAAAERLET